MKRVAIALAGALIALTLMPVIEKDNKANTAAQEEYIREILETEVSVYHTIEAHYETDYDEPTAEYYTESTSPAYMYYNVPLTDEEQETVQTICADFGIDYSLILAIAFVESTYNPDAIGDGGKSIGMYQIQSKWWQGLMDEHGVTDLTDVEQSTTIACAILSQLYQAHTYTDVVLSYYNDGAYTEKGKAYTERVCQALRDLEAK